MTARRVRRVITVWACKCARCGKTWDSMLKAKPTRCPRCQTHNIDKPARPYKPRTR